jgi:hypothetical protein
MVFKCVNKLWIKNQCHEGEKMRPEGFQEGKYIYLLKIQNFFGQNLK